METILIKERTLKNYVDTFKVTLSSYKNCLGETQYIINANNIEYKNVLDKLLIYTKIYSNKTWALKKFNYLSSKEIYDSNK